MHKASNAPDATSRIDSGIKKDTSKKNLRVAGPPTGRLSGRGNAVAQTASAGNNYPVRYGHSLLEQTREDNTRLTMQVDRLKQEISNRDKEIQLLNREIKMKEEQFEEDILHLKKQASGAARSNIQENIDLMRLQREVKDKATKLEALQSQYEGLSMNLSRMKSSHDALLRQLEDTNSQLKQEQSRVVALQGQLKRHPPETNRVIELEEHILDLKRDNAILKEANEKLVTSAFDMEREREWRQRENALRVQIAQLEATLKADLGEKGNILDRLTAEREAAERREREISDLRKEYYKVKEQHDTLKEKMKFFTNESAIDFAEIEEALVLVKQRRDRADSDLDFLQKVNEEKHIDKEKELIMLQADHAETIEELEKTRNMLIVQHQINRDYQQEVEAVNRKMAENETEYQTKLNEFALLLDMRAGRIRKLEAQLKDVAYGTRQYKIRADEEPVGSDVEEYDETVPLERGENLFEIHLGKMDMSNEGLKIIGDEEPSFFCTWEFFEFETMATPVVKSSNPLFDFTSQYVVKVDDFFLHHLQKEWTLLEVHVAMGTDYRTVASCKLRFRDIFEKPHGRVHGIADVISSQREGVVIGALSFWVRLKVPMDQALRLYKERMKALGYITANEKLDTSALEPMDESAVQRSNLNQLSIKIIRCNELKARQRDVQPSPYCVYKFFDYPDHDTTIIHSSNHPEFNDRHTYPVTIAADLDHYLKSRSLEIYVFDDTDPDMASYLGVANVPLLPLAHDKTIKGIFELKQADGSINGTVEVILNWEFSYLPPPAGTKTSMQISAVQPVNKTSSLALMPGESLDSASAASSITNLSSRNLMSSSSAYGGLEQSPSATDSNSSHPTVIRRSPEKRMATKKTVEFKIQEQAQMPTSNAYLNVPTKNKNAGAIRQEQPVPLLNETPVKESATPPVQLGEISKVKDNPVTLPRQIETITSVPTGASNTEGGDVQTSTSAEMVRDEESDELTVSEEGNTLTAEDDPSLSKEITDGGTFFEESDATADEDNEDTDLPVTQSIDSQKDSDPDVISSDSEGIISPYPQARNLNTSITQGDVIVVEISHLTLFGNSDVFNDPDIKRLFVAYSFLGVNPAELETPVSLPKPRDPKQQITFNFRKVFHVDLDSNYSKRQHLASMLLPNSPDEGRILFSVVCEPPEDDESSECFDVGLAFVSIPEILKAGKNVNGADIPILDPDDPGLQIGTLNVTVECLAALLAVKEELPAEK